MRANSDSCATPREQAAADILSTLAGNLRIIVDLAWNIPQDGQEANVLSAVEGIARASGALADAAAAALGAGRIQDDLNWLHADGALESLAVLKVKSRPAAA